MACLYLVPSFLGIDEYDSVFPAVNRVVIFDIKTFIVEDIRTARRFLKKIKYPHDFEEVNFLILNEHSKDVKTEDYLKDIIEGKDVALMSDAGMPCIADPGSIIVAAAHNKNIEVNPLIGPSSLFLALAGSGFNGQSFCFHGYLPIKPFERVSKIKSLESQSSKLNQTQIFIEAPYRNNSLIKDILSTCNLNTYLCIAIDINSPQQYIKTKTIKCWKDINIDFNKRPAVFIIYAL
ncbi:MAG: hypothetical protein A2X12_02455 [Bacteroidetes bacterium GWE2_29_8]|nr:MAG: hypothetical protein A2X12_02455 [Bacteroidetes bacterium GWE2_29_8]OFY14629.1 MAG: hypothetical protein A2X02_06045 [Bacteroidetes bacterium GWF2_29_10]